MIAYTGNGYGSTTGALQGDRKEVLWAGSFVGKRGGSLNWQDMKLFIESHYSL